MFSCRLFLCKLFLLLIFLYFLAHFLLDGNDLGWMPPSPDLSFVTDSPKKKHPDGPLVMKDGILDDSIGKTKSNKLVKAVLMESPMDEIIGITINEGVNGGKKRKNLPISEQFLTKFRQMAKQMHRRNSLKNGFILFSLINRAYLDLTLNWLCNIYSLPMPQNETLSKTKKGKKMENGNAEMLKGILLVALDGGESCKELKRSWPQIGCLSLFEKQQQKLDTDEQKAYNEPLSWGRLRYVHILTARANLMAALAEAKVPFILAEADAIWLRNPMAELFANANLVEDADLVMPLNSAKAKGQRFAFDPMVVFVTNGSRRALQEMRRVLNAEPNKMDQDLLNQLCAQQYGGLVCREFGPDEIVDGAWFKLSEPERNSAAQNAGHWPFVVNNNFYVGVQNKMARQAINGFWFLSAKQKQCNLSKTRRTLEKYQKKP